MPQEQKEEKKLELLLQCWTVAYEKAIVKRIGNRAKITIDEASCEAVEDLTKRLKDAGYITEEETVKSFETMKASIEHHISNLKKGHLFNNPDENFIIPEEKNGVLEITVENCTYQKGCEWALKNPLFNPNKGLYRCQRLGCFVGAVKKYMANLTDHKRDNLKYLMTTIMMPRKEDDKAGIKCRCQGFIFVNEGFDGENMLKKHPPQFPSQG